MLGIVWGIVTVTLLIAYGNSFRSILVGGFDAFGKSVVIAWPQQTSEQPGGLWDRTGEYWLVFDVDGTRRAARQRAIPKTTDLPTGTRVWSEGTILAFDLWHHTSLNSL